MREAVKRFLSSWQGFAGEIFNATRTVTTFPAPGETWSWERHAADPAAALGLRAAFRRFLERHAATGSDLDAAEIIFGELVANVVDHAPGPVRVAVEWYAGHAVLHVRDYGAGTLPPQTGLPPLDAARGRGLYFVRTLALGAEFEASPGNGTYARVILPVRQSV